jgi:hypothetical protein
MEPNKSNQGSLGNNKNAKISILPAIMQREEKDDDGIHLKQNIGTLHNTNKKFWEELLHNFLLSFYCNFSI